MAPITQIRASTPNVTPCGPWRAREHGRNRDSKRPQPHITRSTTAQLHVVTPYVTPCDDSHFAHLIPAKQATHANRDTTNMHHTDKTPQTVSTTPQQTHHGQTTNTKLTSVPQQHRATTHTLSSTTEKQHTAAIAPPPRSSTPLNRHLQITRLNEQNHYTGQQQTNLEPDQTAKAQTKATHATPPISAAAHLIINLLHLLQHSHIRATASSTRGSNTTLAQPSNRQPHPALALFR